MTAAFATPLLAADISPATRARFVAKVEAGPDEACWQWTVSHRVNVLRSSQRGSDPARYRV